MRSLDLSTFSKGNLEKIFAFIILILSSWVVIWMAAPIWEHQNLNDDSFITLTYAKNLANGNGFVYNHPPATLGTTTPLFTVITALLAVVLPFFTVVEVAILVSILAWIGTAWILYSIMRQIDFQPIPAAIAASMPLLIPQGWLGFVGMEMWPFQFLLVLSVYFSIRQKMFYAGLGVGALFLTRGEGALVGLVLGGYLLFSRRKIPAQFILGGLSVVTIWFVYAIATFGTIIPNTLTAKQAQAQLSSGRYFIERMVLDLLPNYFQNFEIFEIWLLNPYLILIGIGLAYALYQKRLLLLFIGWGLLYLVGYTILNPNPYYWYLLHIAFVCQLMAGIGLAWLLEYMLRSRHKFAPSFVAGLITITLALTLFYVNFRFTSNAKDFRGDRRSAAYKAIAQWFNENTNPEDSVAFIEIGYLGYFTNNRIIDLAGLTDPIITEHLVTDGFEWGFWRYQPDYYIYASEFDWALEGIKAAIDKYTLVHQITRNNVPQSIYIFERNNHIDR